MLYLRYGNVEIKKQTQIFVIVSYYFRICIADCVLLLKKGEIIAQGTPIELIEAMSGKVGEIKCCIDEVEMLQNKYKIGNIRQRKEGLALRIVGDELPEEAVITDSDIDLEDVYLYYFE